jgi:hypothetical protein
MKNYIKKIRFTFTIIVSFILMFSFYGCPESNSPTETTNESVTKQIQNSEGGSVELEGFEIQIIPGALPPSKDNNNPVATFSIEIGVDKPASLPTEYKGVSKVVQFGPEGFVLNFPVNILIPVDDVDEPTNLTILTYDYLNEKWREIPISLLEDEPKRVGASVIQLGTFIVAENTAMSAFGRSTKTPKILSEMGRGGIRYGLQTSNYWYCFTIKSATFKYAEQASWYGNYVGQTAMSGSDPTGTWPRNPLHMFLPQGSYQIWVSRLSWDQVRGGEWQTYTTPATVNVDRSLEYKIWSSNLDYAYEGWYDLELPGGEWTGGRPEDLPAMDETVGTGDFQATLTWVNSEEYATDLDLHLYGPDGLHVYFGNEKPEGSAFNLDVDMIEWDLGNAVENIYSVSDNYPKGNYRIVVEHFSGYVPKKFTARIIRFGKSKSVSGTISEGEEKTVDSFTIK